MAKLRTLLILLLCLTVPTAGWASVATAQWCASGKVEQAPHGDTQHESASVEYHHAASHHSHDASTTGEPCKGGTCQHDCACGCGMGACSPSFASLQPTQAGLTSYAGSAAIALLPQQAAAAARGTSPLRPPIG